MAAAAVAEGGSGQQRNGAGHRCDGDRPRRPDGDGIIEIVFGCGARVRLRGEVSSETLRQVIELVR
jgi:hypothetical protein